MAAENERGGRVHVFHSHTPAFRHCIYVAGTQHAHAVATAVVFEFLHQADLCLLLNRLVRGSVFADAEGIVRPNELDGQFHKRGHADGGLHVVGEDEEGAHRRDDAAVERHADADAGHREFRNAGLEEAAAEVGARDFRSVFQEAVRLVGVAEVGRGDNHIGHIFREQREAGGRAVARGLVGLLLDGVPGDFGQAVVHPVVEAGCLFGIGIGPSLLFGVAFLSPSAEFRLALFVHLAHFGPNDEGIFGVAAEVFNRIHVSVAAEGCAMRLAVALVT